MDLGNMGASRDAPNVYYPGMEIGSITKPRANEDWLFVLKESSR